MSEILDYQAGWSIRRIAEELGMAWPTVDRKLRGAGVKPCGERNGNAVYRLRDACEAIFVGQKTPFDAEGIIDPNRLSPRDRRDYWDSEVSRLKAEKEAGRLCEAHAVERELHALIAPVAQMLETLPDILERDASLTPEQAEILQRVIDAERTRCAELIG